MKRCETCRYFGTDPEHCRRGPPVPTGPNTSTRPVTSRLWLCGEYRFGFWNWLKTFRKKKA